MTRPRAIAPCLVLAVASAAMPAAATQWQGGSGANWSTNANWVGGAAPAKSNSGTAEFINPATANTASNVDTPWILNGLDFFNNNWTLTGQAITFIAGGGAGIRLLTNNTISISNSLVFDRAVPVEVTSGASLTLPDVGGSGSLTKTGAGALTVTSLNLGAVTVSQGTLTASPAFGTNNVTVNATLDTDNATWGSLSGGGTVVLNGFATFNQASNTTFTGTISGPGSLQKAGAGTLTLAGNNAWTGTMTTQFGAGTLQIGNGAAGTFPPVAFINNAGSLAIDLPFAAIANLPSMSGPGSLLVAGGTVKQVGGGWDHFGGTTVTGGSLTTTNINSPGAMTVQFPAVWNTGANATVGSLAGNGDIKLDGSLTFGGNHASTTYTGHLQFGSPMGPLGITKIGSGTFTLGPFGNISVPGTFNVNEGTVTGVGGGFGQHMVIKGGAIVMGRGFLGGNLQLNPGATLAPIFFGFGFAYGGGGTLRATLDGTVAATQYTRLSATSGFEADQMILELTGAYVPALGDSFMIVDNAGASPIVGTFDGRAEGSVSTFNGMPLRISYLGGNGNDIVLSVATQTVTPSKTGNGTISPDTNQTVLYGATKAFTIAPAANHHVQSVGGSCPAGTLVGATYTTGAITADCTVVANFAIDTYGVTPSAGANGTISPAGVQAVAHGATQAFTVTPATGYTTVIGGSCPVGTLNGTAYTTGAITANCTVAATFTPNQYTVTPSAGANGTISPTGAQIVSHGATQAFTVTPATGYSASVGGTCPAGTLNGTAYTTGAITGNCTVAATFTLKQYTVTPSAGANGSISPATPQVLGHGSTAVFTVTPSAGYNASVGGTCGGSLAGTSFTTSALTGDCTVAATFSAAPPPAVSLAPASLSFGGQSMGTTSAARTVTLTNSGNATLTVGPITASAQFTQANDCTTLAPAATCTITVTFAPAAAGGALNQAVPVTGSLSVASDAPGSPHTLPLSGTAEKSLVTHYYATILGRAPDAGGAAFWANESTRVAALGANVNEVWFALSAAFYSSPEYLALNRTPTQFVTDLYRTFFNRAPDAAGLSFWTGLMAQGMPREVVLVSYMFSTEFVNFTNAIFGSTAARAEVDAVVDFYRGLLARLPDDGGFNFWVGRFRTAQCSLPTSARAAAITAEVESISSAYALSPEYGARNRSNAQYVGDLYNAFLRRGGDLAGVQFWIDQIATGAQTREQVRVQFRNSAEFQARVQAIIAQGCLQ